jgi:serine/threonine protein kinase
VNNIPVRAPTTLSDVDMIEVGQTQVHVSLQTTAKPQTPAAVSAPGSLGAYELGEVLRQDGMFTTRKAFQASLDRYVAIKLLNDPGDPEFRARFKREARILARLQHPNILPIYEQGEADGTPYLVVQYLDSEAALDDVTGEPMEAGRALRLMGQVLSGLEHAHRQSVVHRNIKPSNILLPLPTWPMLAGFEIAKLLNDSAREQLTREGMAIGTPAYMAPEQAFGVQVDARADLYSVGIVLYELLAGRVPFKKDSAQDMLTAQAYETPPPVRTLNPALPAEAEALLETALMKEPPRRYQSARAMLAALEGLLSIVEGSRQGDPIVKLYEEGVAAFRRGRWDVAVERLERLLTLDPSHEDVESLLETARSEQRASGRRRR